MTDWSKLKVAELKEECKSRDIPLTGLKLKQHYIDKLTDYESQNNNDGGEDAPQKDEEPAEEEAVPKPITEQPSQQASDVAVDEGSTVANGQGTELEDGKKNAREGTPSDKIAEPRQADDHVEDTADHEARTLEETSPAPTPAIDPRATDAILAPEPVEIAERTEEKIEDHKQANGEDSKDVLVEAQSSQFPSDTSTPRTSRMPSSDIAEDRKNRRKRSATPELRSEDVSRKRARLSEEASSAKAVEAIQHMDVDAEIAQEVRMEDTAAVEKKVELEPTPVQTETTSVEPAVPEDTALMPERARSVSRSPSPLEDRDIPPAIHPATSSLYIRNLKRPLHIPTFRQLVTSKAQSPSSDPSSDPVTTFYLDNIRTHAFVTFSSVSAASRVRSAMHGLPLPDTPNGDPLFVDYVPNDRVQSWIDEETDSRFGRGGGGGSRRLFEVVYEDGPDGTEAIFHEVDANKPRPPVEPRGPSRASTSLDRPQTSSSIPAGVHPDRAPLVPQNNSSFSQSRPPPTGPKNSSSASKPSNPGPGTGFKALDELFSSTTAKPKLYYKPVSTSIADERLDMLRDLRVGHDQMGRSGDEGMKRYTFEMQGGRREKWVDKGPEFGHGMRGSMMMRGGGGGGERSYGGRGRGGGGGYRGDRGGGYMGRRGGDSWRAGGR